MAFKKKKKSFSVVQTMFFQTFLIKTFLARLSYSERHHQPGEMTVTDINHLRKLSQLYV